MYYRYMSDVFLKLQLNRLLFTDTFSANNRRYHQDIISKV